MIKKQGLGKTLLVSLFAVISLGTSCVKQSSQSVDSIEFEELQQKHEASLEEIKNLRSELDALTEGKGINVFLPLEGSRNARSFVENLNPVEKKTFDLLYRHSVWSEALTPDQYADLFWKQAKALSSSGNSDQELAALAGLVESKLASSAAPSIHPTESEIREEYQKYRDSVASPPRANIRLILVQSEALANEIVEQVETGKSFMVLALEHSQHSSRDEGGVIEPFARGTYQPSLEDAAFSMSPGDVRKIKSDRGVFIIQKISMIEPVIPSFESSRDRIEKLITTRNVSAAADRILKSLDDDS